MKIVKKSGLLLMALTMFACQPQFTFANKVSSLEQLSCDTFTVETISPEQLPAGIVPHEFDSEAEAMAYINNLNAQIDASLSTSKGTNNVIAPYATYGTALVDSTGVGGGTVSLKINYKTSLDGNRGVVESASAYTDFTGFVLAIEWLPSSTYADILSSGKDVYAFTSGTINYYLLVEGFIKFYSRDITLSGTVAVAR